jgi:diguanylate cyclase (GGDEF)-like protein/PAS domain S-box-containing protein
MTGFKGFSGNRFPDGRSPGARMANVGVLTAEPLTMTVAPGRMRKNLTGVIVEVDDLVLGVLGFTREEMLGKRSTDFLHPDDHQEAFSAWVRMLGDRSFTRAIQVRHRNSAGRWLWVEVTNSTDEADPSTVNTEILLIDRPPDDRTSVSTQLLHHLWEALPFGIAQIDTDQRIVFANGKFDEITGRAAGEHLADRLDGVRPADQPALDEAVRTVLAGDDIEIELELTHPHLGVRRCSAMLSALAGQSGYGTNGALVCLTDITHQVRQRDEILHLATHDDLTKCLNRPAVLDALAAACAADTGVAVIFIDLDQFKAVNDSYGHAAGDLLLVAVADRLRQSTRDAGVGRLGGDEFLVIARNVPTPEHAEHLGRRLARAIRRPLNLGGTIRPSASVGVAWSADPNADPSALVAQADAAMYQAKRRRHRPAGSARSGPEVADGVPQLAGHRGDRRDRFL